MPTAVRIELIENTRSSSRIWTIAAPRLATAVLLVSITPVGLARIDLLVDLGGGLPDQEQAAGDQDQVAPGEGQFEHRLAVLAERPVPGQVEDRLGQADDEGQGREQAPAA